MNIEEILELIDKMIVEWDSVKTWAGVCKRNALKELKDEIVRRIKGNNLRFKEGENVKKNFEWTVVVCCQGQPFYYKYKNLVSALFAYAWHYLKKRKYETMNFSLRQEFFPEKYQYRN